MAALEFNKGRDLARRSGDTGRKRSRERALDVVAFQRELVRGIAAVRRAGGIEDVFEKRRTAGR